MSKHRVLSVEHQRAAGRARAAQIARAEELLRAALQQIAASEPDEHAPGYGIVRGEYSSEACSGCEQLIEIARAALEETAQIERGTHS